jgi:hypothetical protein
MLDALYLTGTVAFFGLMALYVRACAALGRSRVGLDRERLP